MFRKIHLNPENKSFAELMSNGKSYAVPAFQRDYTWEEEQLDELWRDMQYMQAHKAQHFMGYLVRPCPDAWTNSGFSRFTVSNALSGFYLF